MATELPVVKNGSAGATLYTSLVSQSNPSVFQANPTLASGDAQISKDGGAFANLTTLPTVAPASGKAVKIVLSQTETNADNIVIVLSDAAGAEWCDQIIHIQTTARRFDDHAFPNTSGRGMDVDASGGVEVGSFQAGALTSAAFAAGAITATVVADGAIDAGALASDTLTKDKVKNMGSGTVTSGATTTSVPTSACSPTGVSADQFKDRSILFDEDTTTTGLRGVARRITASSAAANPTFTVETLPATPASGDTFAIV